MDFLGLTDSLAVEDGGDDIAVSCYSPGAIESRTEDRQIPFTQLLAQEFGSKSFGA